MAVPIEINGVLFWGIDKGEVKIDEVERISSPNDSILHLLRHFTELPEEWIRQRITEGVTTQDFIGEQLKMPGSKWDPKVNLLIPEDVIHFSQGLFRKAIKQGQELRWIGRGDLDLCYFSHLVTPDEKKHLLGCGPDVSMGVRGLIALKEIPKNVKVNQRFNRGGVVNVVEMDFPETDKVVITFARKETGVIQVFSAFPGFITPPIPRSAQSPEELEHNRAFWGEHALIETKFREGGVNCRMPV